MVHSSSKIRHPANRWNAITEDILAKYTQPPLVCMSTLIIISLHELSAFLIPCDTVNVPGRKGMHLSAGFFSPA